MSKFCKICSDSGKSSSDVHSHNVRERGRVVCPTLLSTECRYCKEKGHTPKFCKKLKEMERRRGVMGRNGNGRTGRHGQRRNIQVPRVVEVPVTIVDEKKGGESSKGDISEDDSEGNYFGFIVSNVPWGDGPGEDAPLQKE